MQVVAQHYDTDVNKEYVIMGNSIILKCQVPSFVADFIDVLSWHTDENEDFYPGENYGYLLMLFISSLIYPSVSILSVDLIFSGTATVRVRS